MLKTADYKLTSSYFSSNRSNNRNLSTSNVEESVQMIKSEVIPCLQNAMETLQNIWSEIGLQEDQKEERTKTVLHHLRNLLQEMVNEEEELKSTLQANVETCTKELEMLSGELGLPVFKVCKPLFYLITCCSWRKGLYAILFILNTGKKVLVFRMHTCTM